MAAIGLMTLDSETDADVRKRSEIAAEDFVIDYIVSKKGSRERTASALAMSASPATSGRASIFGQRR